MNPNSRFCHETPSGMEIDFDYEQSWVLVGNQFAVTAYDWNRRWYRALVENSLFGIPTDAITYAD